MSETAIYYPNSTGVVGTKCADQSWSQSGETELTSTEKNYASLNSESNYVEYYESIAYQRFKFRIPIDSEISKPTSISAIRTDTIYKQSCYGGANGEDRKLFIRFNYNESDSSYGSYSASSFLASNYTFYTYNYTLTSTDYLGEMFPDDDVTEMQIAIGGNSVDGNRQYLAYAKWTVTYEASSVWTPKIMMIMKPLTDGFLEWIRKPLQQDMYLQI